MNQNEEKLQTDIETGKTSGARDVDERAYLLIFRALNKPPSVQPRVDIADAVVKRAMQARPGSESWKDIVWFGTGVFLLLIAFTATLAIWFSGISKLPNLGFLSSLAEYKGLLLFALALVVIFNIAERKLLRTKHYF